MLLGVCVSVYNHGNSSSWWAGGAPLYLWPPLGALQVSSVICKLVRKRSDGGRGPAQPPAHHSCLGLA